MGTELYIYWKVPAAQLQAALQAAHALQAALRRRHPQLQARLLQRVDGSDVATLMETYSHPGGAGPSLQQDIATLAQLHLAPLAMPAVQRHVERFDAH